jgi:hypothetical protein
MRFFVATAVLTAILSCDVASVVAGDDKKEGELTLKILDPDGKPVLCSVERVGNGPRQNLGINDADSGSITITDGCKSGCTLLFFPEAADDYRYSSTHCPCTKNTFTVRPIVTKDKKKLAEHLVASKEGTQQEAAKLALVNNELADSETNKNSKRAYELQSYIEAAKFFGLPSPLIYDPKQKKVVLSPEFQNKIEDYQKEQHLEPTGKLDYRTLSNASGVQTAELVQGPEKPQG